MKNIEYDYDEEADSLYIFRKTEKAHRSFEISDSILIDYAKNREIVGIEILNASKVLAQLDDNRVTQEQLMNISDAILLTKNVGGSAFLVFAIRFSAPNKAVNEIRQNLVLPAFFGYKSPVLAYG